MVANEFFNSAKQRFLRFIWDASFASSTIAQHNFACSRRLVSISAATTDYAAFRDGLAAPFLVFDPLSEAEIHKPAVAKTEQQCRHLTHHSYCMRLPVFIYSATHPFYAMQAPVDAAQMQDQHSTIRLLDIVCFFVNQGYPLWYPTPIRNYPIPRYESKAHVLVTYVYLLVSREIALL